MLIRCQVITLPLLVLAGCGSRFVGFADNDAVIESRPDALSGLEQPAAEDLDGDAIVLTLRQQDSIELDLQLLAASYSALERARAIEPALETIHARPDYATRELIMIPRDKHVTATWTKGELHTGVPALDEELQRFGADGVAVSGLSFIVHFARPLQMVKLAVRLRRLSVVEMWPIGGGFWPGWPEENIFWQHGSSSEQLEFIGVQPGATESYFQVTRWVVDLPQAGAATIPKKELSCGHCCLKTPHDPVPPDC